MLNNLCIIKVLIHCLVVLIEKRVNFLIAICPKIKHFISEPIAISIGLAWRERDYSVNKMAHRAKLAELRKQKRAGGVAASEMNN